MFKRKITVFVYLIFFCLPLILFTSQSRGNSVQTAVGSVPFTKGVNLHGWLDPGHPHKAVLELRARSKGQNTEEGKGHDIYVNNLAALGSEVVLALNFFISSRCIVFA